MSIRFWTKDSNPVESGLIRGGTEDFYPNKSEPILSQPNDFYSDSLISNTKFYFTQ